MPKQNNKTVSLAALIDLVLLDQMRKQGGMSKLKLMRSGLTRQAIRQMEFRGILRASTDALGITQYTVVDDFLTKLT